LQQSGPHKVLDRGRPDPQIDKVARRRLAELIRHLAAGRITNFEFDDAVPQSQDRAVHSIYRNGLWPLYDDLQCHRMTGKWTLTPQERGWMARIILFLRSDFPYRYPVAGRWRWLYALPAKLLTLGLFDAVWWRYASRSGDKSVWPFYSKEELERALEQPVHLRGRADGELCLAANRDR
jgi:hypothetical protein